MIPGGELNERTFCQQQLYPLIQMLGWHRYHCWLSKNSPGGYPDETLVRERIVFLEVKTEKGKPTHKQIQWLGWLADAGAEVYIIRPRNFDDLAKVLALRRTEAQPSFGPIAGEARGRLLLELDHALGRDQLAVA